MSKTKFTQTGDLKARSRLVASFFFIAIQLLETEKAPSLYISKMNKILYLLNSDFFIKKSNS